MPYDRCRRPGEDVLAYAVETDRVSAESVPGWRSMIAAGAVSEAFIERLASPYKPEPTGRRMSQHRTDAPIGASAGDSLSPVTRAKMATTLGLHANASGETVLATIDRLKTKVGKTAETPVAAASSQRPVPLINADANPLVYELASRSPQGFKDALTASGGRVPTLFPDGDLPSATASGIAPHRLAAAYWGARPAIAAEPDPSVAEELLAAASGPNGSGAMAAPEIAGHPRLRDYQDEVHRFVESAIPVMRRRGEDQQIAAGRAQRASLDTRRERSIVAAAGGPCSEDDYKLLFGHLEDAS